MKHAQSAQTTALKRRTTEGNRVTCIRQNSVIMWIVRERVRHEIGPFKAAPVGHLTKDQMNEWKCNVKEVTTNQMLLQITCVNM